MTGNNQQQSAKVFILIFIVLGAVVFGFWQMAKQTTQTQDAQIAFSKKKAPSATPTPFVDGAIMRVTVGSATTSAEVAQSDAKKRLGLGMREKLDAGTGMLFAFNNPGPCPNSCSFWNKDMLFPIDIVWIRDGTVVDLYGHLPAYAKQKDFTIMTKAQVNFILEVPDGFIKTNNIKIGDTVTYEPEKN